MRPSINITTDFIVGFPTETNEDFEESLEIARKIKFGKIHVFPFTLKFSDVFIRLTYYKYIILFFNWQIKL